MSSRYITYYSNTHYFVTLAGDVELRYEVRAKDNPHRVLETFTEYDDEFADDRAIANADDLDTLEIAKREKARAAAKKPKRGRTDDEQE